MVVNGGEVKRDDETILDLGEAATDLFEDGLKILPLGHALGPGLQAAEDDAIVGAVAGDEGEALERAGVGDGVGGE